MEINYQQQKLDLLKSQLSKADQNPIAYQFNVAGVEVRFFIHGESQKEILHFFHYYFEHFPSEKRNPDLSIHYLSFPLQSEFSNPLHSYWNDPDEEFRISTVGHEQIIIQRDFAAIQNLITYDFFATGPLLDQGCCDSTDNLVQYALGKHLIKNHILPLHAATVVMNKKAYVFFGESGAGKSTLATQSYELDQLKIMGGDQIFLKSTPKGLIAHANTTTIFGFHRDHPAWNHQPRPVEAIIHLTKSPREYNFQHLSFREAMPLILRETVSWREAVSPDSLLDLILKIGENKNIKWGEFSYKKGDSFWSHLLEDMK